jgi:hypothetical protein
VEAEAEAEAERVFRAQPVEVEAEALAALMAEARNGMKPISLLFRERLTLL